MLIKTDELMGRELDWAVVMASGLDKAKVLFENGKAVKMFQLDNYVVYNCSTEKLWQPSTDGAIAAKIIEEAEISTNHAKGRTAHVRWQALIHSKDKHGMFKVIDAWGPTCLIAAMRCFVKLHLGEEIDIPNI